MTKGSILKKLCIFAAPCILGRVLQNLYTLVDSVIAGQAINTTALAAVGATGSLVSLFTDTVIGLMTGFSVTAGKNFGAKNEKSVKKVFVNSLFVTFGISILITVFGFIFARDMLVLMKTPAELLDGATHYLKIIFLGISTSVFYNFFCEMLRAIGNSKEPLIFLIVSSILHLALLVLLTFGLNTEITGVALSTVLSQGVAVLMCVRYIRKKVPSFKITKEDIKIDFAVLKECFRIGIPMGITNFVVAFGVIILSFITNKIGTEYVAAYSCASKTGYIITTPIFGFATAASVFASQNLGAGKPDRIKEGIRKVNITVTLINCVLFVIFFFAARPLLSFMLNGDKFAVDAGALYLNMRCVSMFVLTFAAVFKNVLTGLGKPFFPTVSGFLEIAVRYIIPITLSEKLGFITVPLTDAASWLMLALFLTPAYIYEFKKLKNGEVKNEKQ